MAVMRTYTEFNPIIREKPQQNDDSLLCPDHKVISIMGSRAMLMYP